MVSAVVRREREREKEERGKNRRGEGEREDGREGGGETVFSPSKIQGMIGGDGMEEPLATTKLFIRVIPIPYIKGNSVLKACWANMP